MEKARAEASALRDALERKDEQLRSASARGDPRRGSRRASIPRLGPPSQLESGVEGYDAEIARVSAELASLQTMLAQREEVFEEMQGRLNREVEEESDARNREISDARAEMCQMQTLLEKMAADVEPRFFIFISRRNSPPLERRVADANAPPPPTRAAEAEAASLRATLAEKEQAYDAARAEIDALRQTLAEASKLAGVAPPRRAEEKKKTPPREPIAAEPNRRGDFVRVRVHRGGTGVVFVLVCSDRGRVDGVHGRGALGRDAHPRARDLADAKPGSPLERRRRRRDGGDAARGARRCSRWNPPRPTPSPRTNRRARNSNRPRRIVSN